MIKMIVCDLDRTLLDSNKKIHDDNLIALKKAQENGVVLVLASGRNINGMEHIFNQLDMPYYKSGYIVGVNGAQIYSFKNETLDIKDSLTLQDVMKIKSVAKKLKYIVFGLKDDACFISGGKMIHWLMNHPKFQKKFLSDGYDGRLPNPTYSYYDEENEGIIKICLQSLKFHFTSSKKVRSLLNDYQVMNVSPGWFEIMPKNINKSVGVKEIMALHGFDNDELMIFGDSENDIEMLKLTKHSYAMDNALKEVKRTACNVIGSHNTNAISKVLKNNKIV